MTLSNKADKLKQLIESKNNFSKWQSPSNIAIVKYWGKKAFQTPSNASVSFTLSHCRSETTVEVDLLKEGESKIDFLFEGKERADFAKKIESYFELLESHLPWMKEARFTIHSKNTFPHSAGIASSASSMSALALCLYDIDQKLGSDLDQTQFLKKVSFAARIGSGSACRSVFPKAAFWGKIREGLGEDPFAYPVNDIHSEFEAVQDSILIVSDGEKSVSSRAGHALMKEHPYAKTRFSLANQRCLEVLTALGEGDWNKFGEILELEALELHSLMMMSTPSFILMEPLSLELIKLIRKKRAESGLRLYFTLDAGPNIHLIYPHKEKEAIRKFIDEDLRPLLPTKTVIHDEMGQGPSQL